MTNKEKYYYNNIPFASVIAYTALSRKYVTTNPKNTDKFPMYSDWMEIEVEDEDYSNVSDILAEELFERIKKADINLDDASGLKRVIDNFGLEIKHIITMLDVERKWKEHDKLTKLNKEE